MIYNEQKSFGYPVATTSGKDFVDGGFQTQYFPSISNTGVATIRLQHEQPPCLTNLLREKKIQYATIIRSTRTLMQSLHKYFDKGTKIEISLSEYFTKIEIESYLICKDGFSIEKKYVDKFFDLEKLRLYKPKQIVLTKPTTGMNRSGIAGRRPACAPRARPPTGCRRR